MKEIDPGLNWELIGAPSSLDGHEEIRFGVGHSPANLNSLEAIWDKRQDTNLDMPVRGILLNHQVDGEEVVFAPGWGVPIDSDALAIEASLIAQQNPNIRVHLLNAPYRIPKRVTQQAQGGDFRGYGRLYGDYLEQYIAGYAERALPEHLAGHSLGARAMVALALDSRYPVQSPKTLSASEPSGARRMRMPFTQVAVRGGILEGGLTLIERRRYRHIEDYEHFKRVNRLFGQFLLDVSDDVEGSYTQHEVYEETAAELPAALFYQISILRGLGRAGLAHDVSISLRIHQELQMTLWSGLKSLNVPHRDLAGLYFELPPNLKSRLELWRTNSRHNSGVAMPSKFAQQIRHSLSRS